MNISSISRAIVAAVVVTLVTTAATAFSAAAAVQPMQGSLRLELRDGKDRPVGGAQPVGRETRPSQIPSRFFHAASWSSNGFPPAAPALWYRLTTFAAPRAL